MVAQSITLPDSLMAQMGKAGRDSGSLGLPTESGATSKSVNTSKTIKNTQKSSWQVPVLEKTFALAPALKKAYELSQSYMNTLLAPDGMHIEGAEKEVVVRENGSQRALRIYNQQDILGLYAHNIGRNGIVVDGKV